MCGLYGLSSDDDYDPKHYHTQNRQNDASQSIFGNKICPHVVQDEDEDYDNNRCNKYEYFRLSLNTKY